MSYEKGAKDSVNKKTFSINLDHSSDISDYNEIHKHSFSEVIYVISGEIELLIDFSLYKIKKGDSILINSNIYHAVLKNKNSDFEFLRWSFLPEYIYAYGKDIYNVELFLWFAIKERNTFSVINTENVPEIKDLFLRAFDRFSKKDYGFELDFYSDTLSLCLNFFGKWSKENRKYIRDLSAISIGEIKKVLFYIEENCDCVSVEEVSERFNIKNVVFAKSFKVVTGYGVSEYIDLWRMRRAMFLLATTTQTITDIAVSVGYSTPSYFSKRFHAHTSKSPSDFRKDCVSKSFCEKNVNDEILPCEDIKQEKTDNRLYYDSIIASIFYERYISDYIENTPFFNLYYVDKGFFDVECGGVLYHLEEGDIFLVCLDEQVKLFSDRACKKGIFVIQFYPEFLMFGQEDNFLFKDLLYYTKFPYRNFSVDKNDTEISEALNQINLARINRGVDFELVMRAGFTKIISWMLKKQYEKMGAIFYDKKENISDNIEQILTYINEHYTEKISLSEVADKFFVNYSYLSRTLKRITGKCFNAYLRDKKLLKATFLLITTDEPVSEISRMLGFCSQGYFTEEFKKRIFSMTPTEFRRRFKKKVPYTDAYRYEY